MIWDAQCTFGVVLYDVAGWCSSEWEKGNDKMTVTHGITLNRFFLCIFASSSRYNQSNQPLASQDVIGANNSTTRKMLFNLAILGSLCAVYFLFAPRSSDKWRLWNVPFLLLKVHSASVLNKKQIISPFVALAIFQFHHLGSVLFWQHKRHPGGAKPEI